MPLAMILAGVILLDVAFRGTEHDFAKQLAADFGQSQFWAWAAAIAALGALGYAKPIRPVSTAGMTLVLVVLILRNGGAFTQIASLVRSPPKAAPAVPLSAYGSSGSSSGGGSGGSSSGGGGVVGSLLGGGDGGSGGGDLFSQVAQLAGFAGFLGA